MTRLHADRLVFLVLLLTLLMPVGLAAAQEHTLTLDRERPVGAKYQVRLQGTQTQQHTQTLNNQEAGGDTHKIAGNLTGIAEVLAVHKNKQVKAVALEIKKFQGTSDEETLTLDTTKRLVIIAKAKSIHVEYEDGSAVGAQAAEVIELLAMFMVNKDPDKTPSDKIFKLDQPRTAGSAWACDNELLAKDIARGGELVIEPKNIESEFKFLDLAEFAGQRSAVFDLKVKMKDFSLPGAKEQGLAITRSDGEMNMSGLMPLDPKSGDGAMQMQMKMQIAADLTFDQGQVKMNFDIAGQVDAEFREIK